MSSRFVVIDTEATGTDTESDEIVEIGAVEVDPECPTVGIPESCLCNPGIPIPPEASAVHHIIDTDVKGAEGIASVLYRLCRKYDRDTYFVAHNAPFDRDVMDLGSIGENRKWIDTLRLAKHAWPDAPNYKNQTLRYYLTLPIPRSLPANRVECDILCTAHVLLRAMEALGTRDPEELIEVAARPVELQTVPFGKHKGEAWSEVPTDYLQWVLRTDFDDDIDIHHTAEAVLSSREMADANQ